MKMNLRELIDTVRDEGYSSFLSPFPGGTAMCRHFIYKESKNKKPLFQVYLKVSILYCHCQQENGRSWSRRSSATSMVVTLHWRAHSLSVDLIPFEISATGGRKRFVHPAGFCPHPQWSLLHTVEPTPFRMTLPLLKYFAGAAARSPLTRSTLAPGPGVPNPLAVKRGSPFLPAKMYR